MPSTLDVKSLEDAVARTVERVKSLNAEKQDLEKQLAAAKKKLTATEKKLKNAQSQGKKADSAEDTTEVRQRLGKLEADLSALLEGS